MIKTNFMYLTLSIIPDAAQFIWLLLITVVVLITTPIWIVPYAAYKLWKELK